MENQMKHIANMAGMWNTYKTFSQKTWREKIILNTKDSSEVTINFSRRTLLCGVTLVIMAYN
jgi:hypothetical protein